MTRKDSEKESERPHYYSQFWLDIAAGRRTIGGPKPEDEGELLDDAPEPISLRRPLRDEPDEDLDENEPATPRRTTSVRSSVAPVVNDEDEDVEEEPEEEPLVTDDGEDFSQDEDIADADIPDMDLAADEDVEDEDEDAEEELFEDEDEEEDEEEEGWVAGRGRKKPSPKRPTKQPPVRRPKRDNRRSF